MVVSDVTSLKLRRKQSIGVCSHELDIHVQTVGLAIQYMSYVHVQTVGL